jgi:hypothetical protein
MVWLYRDYARFRACCPEAKYRDGKKAVELATKGLDMVGKDADWKYFAALAAAYAELGEWDKAVVEQRKALDDKSLDSQDRAQMEERMDMYRNQKPYRDQD